MPKINYLFIENLSFCFACFCLFGGFVVVLGFFFFFALFSLWVVLFLVLSFVAFFLSFFGF